MSRGKKNRKKDSTNKRNGNEKSSKGKEKRTTSVRIANHGGVSGRLFGLFREEELVQLRNKLKSDDLSDVPPILAATILCKKDLVVRLLSSSHAVDERGPDQWTPLKWAIKSKSSALIDLLLDKGANVVKCTTNGDHPILIALESVDWTQTEFLELFNKMKKYDLAVEQMKNRTGNSLLHHAVKRQWSAVVAILLESKTNVNCTNVKGITPLMMAGARNNPVLVKTLVDSGANVNIEDERGCTAICYTVAYIVQKRLEPPHDTLEALVEDGHCTDEYLKRRLDLLKHPPTGKEPGFPHIITTVISAVLSFFMRYKRFGHGVLWDLRVFEEISKAFDMHMDEPGYLLALLGLVFELIRSCECCSCAEIHAGKVSKLAGDFISCGGADFCLRILQRYGDDTELLSAALMPLFFGCVIKGKPLYWLQKNASALYPFHNRFLDKCSFPSNNDDSLIRTTKNKVRLFQEILEKIQKGERISYIGQLVEKSDLRQLKTRLCDCSSFQLVPKGYHQEGEGSDMEDVGLQDSKIIVSGVLKIIENVNFDEDWYESKAKTFSVPPSDYLRGIEDPEERLEMTVQYLQSLADEIVTRYEWNWARDKALGYPDFEGIEVDLTILDGTREEQIEKLNKILPRLEQAYLMRFKENFKKLLESIKMMGRDPHPSYERLVEQLESLLLNHSIRDECIVDDFLLNNDHDEFIGLDEIRDYKGTVGDPPEITTLQITEVPNKKHQCHKCDSHGYLEEMLLVSRSMPKSSLTDQQKREIKKRTMDHAYHLTDSILTMLESDDTSTSSSDTTSEEPEDCSLNDSLVSQDQAAITATAQARICSRWDTMAQNLGNLSSQVVLAGGSLRMSDNINRSLYMLSTGGNFGDVELGLDPEGRPYAVKRIPRHNNVACKTLKSTLNPLLGIRHKNLLHYVVCEYDGSELILAASLCEFNLGEYLMCLKLNQHLSVTTDDLVKQLLTGLWFLHSRTEPIVHGNLKPSNVLIDQHGTVRLAEFGMHKALYQDVQPPKSSVIWFARETYEYFKHHSTMQCTVSSDVQVAGMLVHFVMTGGLHPYGIVTEDILENLVLGSPHLSVTNCDLSDLISWMLVYEAADRPAINQVMTHVYFWETDRKWRFVLTCAGITQHGSPLPLGLERFHAALDAMADREGVKGDWMAVIKDKMPRANLTSYAPRNMPTGLLKYIRACVEHGKFSHVDLDLKTFFLEAFPALTLSLFRLIENTEWIKHPVFVHFADITNVSA